MKWWYAPLLLIDLYLLVTLAPAIAAQIVQWLILRAGPFLEEERARLARLLQSQRHHSSLWPQEPRVGRYQEIDSAASQALAEVRADAAWAEQLLTRLDDYRTEPLTFPEVMKLGAWRPLIRSLRAKSQIGGARRHLQRGERGLATLAGLERQLHSVPDRVRASLGELRAEASRLLALLEAERDSGTRGLEDIWQHTQSVLSQIEAGLDAIAAADPERVPEAVAVIDGELTGLSAEINQVHQQVTKTTRARDQAREGLRRLDSALGLALERWEALKQRGATDPAIARALDILQRNLAQVEGLTATRTTEAYVRTAQALHELDGQMAELDDAITELDRLLQASRAATEGDVQALAEVQHLCQQLVSADPLIEPDICLNLIEAASACYIEAERQHGLGTAQGYQESMSLATQAAEHLSRARASTAELPAQSQEIRHLGQELSPTTISHWRSRAVRLREEMQVYGLHWQSEWAVQVMGALDQLEQIEVNLERMPPNVRYQRRFRQSEMGEALTILRAAHEALAKSSQGIQALEQELAAISAKRQRLDQALLKLTEETLPALQESRERMLPELRDRHDQLHAQVAQQIAELRDPASTDYDRALDQWLPLALSQLEELAQTHAGHVSQSARALDDVEADLEHLWSRLERLDPLQSPGPSEDLERLADDLDLWRRDAQEWEQNPAMLVQLVGARARSLAQRIEKARGEVIEGRRTLETLVRELNRRVGQARTVRQAIRDLRLTSRWSHLEGETQEAREAWERALVLERDSRSSALLSDVIEQIRRAINAAEEAEQLYGSIEGQMRSAMRRLDSELRSVHGALERARRRLSALDEDGSLDAAAALRIRCNEAAHLANRSQAASSFEEALRLLRDARELLGRG